MFERFTEGARRVVALAQEEARLLDHNHIGSEHLLLGLAHDNSGVAAHVLAAVVLRTGQTRRVRRTRRIRRIMRICRIGRQMAGISRRPKASQSLLSVTGN
jgi:ATP-dependent Clp protease ATP-binding subunit ClpA